MYSRSKGTRRTLGPWTPGTIMRLSLGRASGGGLGLDGLGRGQERFTIGRDDVFLHHALGIEIRSVEPDHESHQLAPALGLVVIERQDALLERAVEVVGVSVVAAVGYRAVIAQADRPSRDLLDVALE